LYLHILFHTDSDRQHQFPQFWLRDHHQADTEPVTGRVQGICLMYCIIRKKCAVLLVFQLGPTYQSFMRNRSSTKDLPWVSASYSKRAFGAY